MICARSIFPSARFGGTKVQIPAADAVVVPRINVPLVNTRVSFGAARPVSVASEVTASVWETPVSFAR